MLRTRVIPCLLLRDGGLVKGCRFKNHQYVGDPINAIKIFNDKEVDELLVLDIGATNNRSGPDFNFIEQFASECFIPLSYGGGISSLQQAATLFSLGIEKVCIQSAAIYDLKIIESISNQFGSQSVVVSIDIKTDWLGRYQLFHAARRKTLNRAWIEFIQSVVAAGAGEVVINSVDREGLMEGMDFRLVHLASEAVSIPVIATGGAGSLDDIKSAANAGASAVAAGAFFVYHGPHRAVLITFPEYAELEALLS